MVVNIKDQFMTNRSAEVETVSTAKSNDSDIPERETWGSRAEFLLSCVGLSVGIGNVWRFPYLAYQNGGGAFLLPYTILLILIGKPMYFMELALGQYSGLGPLSVWRCSPVAMGVGAAMLVISLIVAIYYTVIVAYTVFYLAASFASEVPWATCGEGWSDEMCYQRGKNVSTVMEELKRKLNLTMSINGTNDTCQIRLQTASEQYWSKYVLHLHESNGIGDLGEVRWDLALCLLFTWIIVFLCLFKGIQSSGKAVYFTATFPYVILLILFFRGVTLEGASSGIIYFFLPQWEKLLTIQAWTKAAEQMFYSLSISWGGLIMFGSYSNFKTRIHVDALVVSSLDFITSIIAGVVIFSVLGALSLELGRDISEVVKSGPGLAFVAYPEALARLPIPQLWSVLFFFMLFTLGLDSEFSTLETVLTAIYDEYPITRKYKHYVCLVACICCYLLGLPCVTNGGQYVLELMDNYGGGFTVLVIGALEMVALMWIYGMESFPQFGSIHNIKFINNIYIQFYNR
ncbi:Solute carrier 6, variant 2 [Chamberlinius hualienensis]